MVEYPKSKSTQPRFARRWVSLYLHTVCKHTRARANGTAMHGALSPSLSLSPPFFSFSSSKRSRQNRPTDRPTDRDLSLLWVMSPLCVVVVVLGHRPRNRTARDHGGRKRKDKHEAGNDMRGGGVLRSCVCTFRFRAGWRLHSVRQGRTRTGSVGMETLPCNNCSGGRTFPAAFHAPRPENCDNESERSAERIGTLERFIQAPAELELSLF